jgi:four helix bundle protein
MIPNKANPPVRRLVNGFRDLLVWGRAMDLVVEGYRLTDGFPREEKYGLVQQLRRAAVSVPSNIAEGHGRDHLGDYLRHLSIANGSLMELETQVLIAGRMGYVRKEVEERILTQASEVGRMLSGLIRALKKRSSRLRNLTPDT